MSKFLLFLGCTIPTKQYSYEISVRNVLPKLGVELVDFPESGCCGFPLKGLNKKAWIYMSARLLSLASKKGLPILALCNGCDTSLRKIKDLLMHDKDLREEMAKLLSNEGVKLDINAKVYHTLEVLHDFVGVERIKSLVQRPLKGIKVASYPGCHMLRPSDIPRPEDPVEPRKYDSVIKALGAEVGYYPDKGGCCGATLLPYSAKHALLIVASKLKTIKEYGFSAVSTSCPYCMEMIDAKQDAARSEVGDEDISIPVFYLTQLVGIAMGLKPKELGLNLNVSPVEGVLDRLGVSLYE
ncbi:MAG: CoB--CoM heterodisulfide reductase iron-sulfur subunit B family protein [Sulfolobales archaeon]|nr:CoB--CoM heterodisulfide reductase iron-sulfur subunit B family protein [Sulfolobales archaeon]MCX8186272.1 CoB--CoM heterodisulfide reductase iron-sulfur subunit B family protein [Sulfolobales archaeon]MDW7968992.1 CoB--CoM heterodisulfide reductase iron-sulfur subunit B family protein [Sulfolobales archaeon]